MKPGDKIATAFCAVIITLVCTFFFVPPHFTEIAEYRYELLDLWASQNNMELNASIRIAMKDNVVYESEYNALSALHDRIGQDAARADLIKTLSK